MHTSPVSQVPSPLAGLVLTSYDLYIGDPSPAAQEAAAAALPDHLKEPLLGKDVDEIDDLADDEEDSEQDYQAVPGPFRQEDVAELKERVEELNSFMVTFARRTKKPLSSVVRLAGIALKFTGRKKSLWNLYAARWAHNTPMVEGR